MIRKLVLPVIAASALLVPTGVAVAQQTATKATTITVTAGSPSEFKFKLSKMSAKAGLVTFKVTNKGALPHDFKIAGKKTPILQTGKSATVKVKIKKGANAYLCTVSGHAAAGMKGVLKGT
jgi:nitrite reductase (NO-forming)